MKVLNLYFSSTGNTEKVALKIDETVQKLGYPVDTIKISSKEHSLDILNYDFVGATNDIKNALEELGVTFDESRVGLHSFEYYS